VVLLFAMTPAEFMQDTTGALSALAQAAEVHVLDVTVEAVAMPDVPLQRRSYSTKASFRVRSASRTEAYQIQDRLTELRINAALLQNGVIQCVVLEGPRVQRIDDLSIHLVLLPVFFVSGSLCLLCVCIRPRKGSKDSEPDVSAVHLESRPAAPATVSRQSAREITQETVGAVCVQAQSVGDQPALLQSVPGVGAASVVQVQRGPAGNVGIAVRREQVPSDDDVGIVVRREQVPWVIDTLVFQGPAEKTGKLKVGDVIRAVNGISALPDTAPAMVAMLRGDPGTVVTITIERARKAMPASDTSNKHESDVDHTPVDAQTQPPLSGQAADLLPVIHHAEEAIAVEAARSQMITLAKALANPAALHDHVAGDAKVSADDIAAVEAATQELIARAKSEALQAVTPLDSRVADDSMSNSQLADHAEDEARQARQELILRVKREVMQRQSGQGASEPSHQVDTAADAALRELIAQARLKAVANAQEQAQSISEPDAPAPSEREKALEAAEEPTVSKQKERHALRAPPPPSVDHVPELMNEKGAEAKQGAAGQSRVGGT